MKLLAFICGPVGRYSNVHFLFGSLKFTTGQEHIISPNFHIKYSYKLIFAFIGFYYDITRQLNTKIEYLQLVCRAYLSPAEM